MKTIDDGQGTTGARSQQEDAPAEGAKQATRVSVDTLLDQALGRGALRIRPFRLRLADAGTTLDEVLAHPRVGRLHTLEVARQELPPAAIDTLLAWHGLDGVRSLALHINDLGTEGILRLLRSPKLAQLRSLEVQAADGNDTSMDEATRFVVALMHDTPLPRLRRLRFGCHGAGEAASRAIGTYTGFPRLVSLDYSMATGTAPIIVDGLITSGRLGTLRELALDQTNFDDECLRRVLASGMTQGLRTLTVRLANLQEHGIGPLAQAQGKLPSLRRLTMSAWGGVRTSLAELAKMEAPALRWLDLAGAPLDGKALDAITGAAFWPQMLGVSLDGYPVDGDGVQRLIVDPRSRGLRRVRMNGVTFDEGALALFRARPGVMAEVMRQWLVEEVREART